MVYGTSSWVGEVSYFKPLAKRNDVQSRPCWSGARGPEARGRRWEDSSRSLSLTQGCRVEEEHLGCYPGRLVGVFFPHPRPLSRRSGGGGAEGSGEGDFPLPTMALALHHQITNPILCFPESPTAVAEHWQHTEEPIRATGERRLPPATRVKHGCRTNLLLPQNT